MWPSRSYLYFSSSSSSFFSKPLLALPEFSQMEEFNQGLNWAYALAADAFGQLTVITGKSFLS
jgi:hypothetical protein